MKTNFTILLGLFLVSFSGFTQTTLIPDSNFEQALINLGLDSGPVDGGIPTANISSLDSLDIDNKSINNLTGIEDFSSLTYLHCSFNLLTNINISQNTALTNFVCEGNQLTSIDVSQNTSLTFFGCGNNQLTSIDVTQNTALTNLYCMDNMLTNVNLTLNPNIIYFYCWNNQLSDLNLSQNGSLSYLNCNDNQLNCIDLKNGNNTNMVYFNAINNPWLNCIEVDNVSFFNSNWPGIASYSNNCNYTSCFTSIYDYKKSEDILVYPNPSNGEVYVDLGKTFKKITFILKNSLGQILFEGNNLSSQTIYLDITDKPKGIYFLELNYLNNEFKTIKINRN